MIHSEKVRSWLNLNFTTIFSVWHCDWNSSISCTGTVNPDPLPVPPRLDRRWCHAGSDRRGGDVMRCGKAAGDVMHGGLGQMVISKISCETTGGCPQAWSYLVATGRSHQANVRGFFENTPMGRLCVPRYPRWLTFTLNSDVTWHVVQCSLESVSYVSRRVVNYCVWV